MVLTALLPKLGGFAKSMAGIGSGVKKIGGKFFGGIHKTFVKGKKGIKGATNLFKEIRKVAEGPMQGIFSLIEAFGILDPLFRVFAAIIKMFTAGFLIKMMPLFIRFVAIITDPEYMRYVMALGAFFANTMIPALEVLLSIMEAMQGAGWFTAWADFWEEAAANEGSFKLMIRRFTDFYYLVIDFGTAVYNAAQPLRDFSEGLENLKFPTIPSYSGGGSSGGGGGGGGVVEKIKETLGLQQGTPFIQSDGWRYLHRGESVNTANETAAKATQMEDMLLLQEQTLSVQKDILHYMKYEV